MILGIDSALSCAGVAVIDIRLEIVYTGCIITNDKKTLQENLAHIFHCVNRLLEEFPILAVAVEDNFVGVNSNVTKRLSNVVGVVLLACQMHGIPAYLYPPATHKKITANDGRASKAKTRLWVRDIFQYKDEDLTEDEIDALSLAYCLLQKEAKKFMHLEVR